MIRTLGCCLLCLGLVAAEGPLPPLEAVPDPFGLGPRLALIDYMREDLGVEPAKGVSLEGLEAQYLRLRAERAAALDPTPERLADLARELWVEYGIAAPDGVTVPQLEALLADERAKVAGELALQQAQAAEEPGAPGPDAGALGPREREVEEQPLAGGAGGFELADGRGVSLQSITALRERANGRELEPRDIAARCAQAVTLIFTEHGTGTGFFINRSGLMLTCAHVLPERGGKLGIKHLSEIDGQAKSIISGARLIAVDAVADLALLQVDTEARTSSVVFEDRAEVAMGDEVVVIGNPGAGGGILERTMTQGIVSSPSRIIKGIDHIQTSAAVNPGNSGGPVFNQRGNLVALVVSKASDVEGVGFAVALDELEAFLKRCIR